MGLARRDLRIEAQTADRIRDALLKPKTKNEVSQQTNRGIEPFSPRPNHDWSNLPVVDDHRSACGRALSSFDVGGAAS